MALLQLHEGLPSLYVSHKPYVPFHSIYDDSEAHSCPLAGGNIRLVAGLAAGLPIIYNSVVQSIEYSEDRVRVSAGSRSFEGNLPSPLFPPSPRIDVLGALQDSQHRLTAYG